jgi:transposase
VALGGIVSAERETAMNQDIILVVDYHDAHCVIRELDRSTGGEAVERVPTAEHTLAEVVDQAATAAKSRGGGVVWLQESTTGWARVKRFLAGRADFLLANMLQMPQPPKGKRRKTDKIDTARLLREYLNGELPLAFQPADDLRQVRRVVALRENLVARRTALRNWINRYLAHETWHDRKGLWSKRGLPRLRKLELPPHDRFVIDLKLDELESLTKQLEKVELRMFELYQAWPAAQQLDAIRGIASLSAVSILARIGPIKRFRDADALVAFAGLAPGIRQSDENRRSGRLGGGGTDKHLRHYVLEAAGWACELPRYRSAYLRTQQRRGNKVARLVVARMLLRSIYKMLHDHVPFTTERTAK